MSRLDSFIRRLTAQRACLDEACRAIAGLDGPALEIGLGNGRTFDHLRRTLPDREVYVFDRRVAAHPDSTPDEDHLFLGDLSDTLPEAADALPEPAALVHSDIGSGYPDVDRRVAEMMADLLPALLAPGAVVISDQDIPLAEAEDIPLPDGIQQGRYFFRRYLPDQGPMRMAAGARR